MMNKCAKNAAALLLSASMLLVPTACSGSSDDANVNTITYWIAVGEDVSYYPDYDDNPVLNYIQDNYTFNGKKLKIDFNVAPPGSQSEDFTNQIGTGGYCGVMDMSMASLSAQEMYEEGLIWDLTELVPAHMPNLMAFLKENPELEQYMYTYVNGEKKILYLVGFSDEADPNFQGYCYRRDWVAKYGSNPKTGEAFSYGFTDANDSESWEDNVIFPNGTNEPIYISDWEWMFEIFTRAIEDQGIDGGYCFSPYYKGYMDTGDLATGFGGGGPTWYADGDKCIYGVTTDNFQAYLKCLNTWYKNGWLNRAYDERSGDMFYGVDTSSVFQGKVGLWQGRVSTVGTQIDADDGFTKGAVVYGCRQPINDIYGGKEQQGKEPNLMFQYGQNGQTAVITDKMSEEQVIAFLEFIDFLYSDEGSLLASFGLNKDQQETAQSEYYKTVGLTEGSYYIEDVNGTPVFHTYLDITGTQHIAATLGRVNIKLTRSKNLDRNFDRYVTQATQSWDYYKETAKLPHVVSASLTVEQNQEITKIRASLDQFLERTVSVMIKGEGYDVWDDAQWEQFCKDVNKYRANEVTEIYQDILDNAK